MGTKMKQLVSYDTKNVSRKPIGAAKEERDGLFPNHRSFMQSIARN